MFRFLLIGSLALVLAACGSSPKTNFYVLNSGASDSFANENTEAVGVGVWKVVLPSMLDRPEIVTRSGQQKIELADFHQWAGGLANNMSNLIASDLGQRLKSNNVVTSPWPAYRKNDYQIKIDVNNFGGELGKNIIFTGVWSLLNAEGKKELQRKAFRFETQAAGKNYSDMVAALTKLTVQLSEQIATAISSQGTTQ